ncbi:alpha-N-acetylglucosaminidase [Prevotella sp. 10(H)]|uniref:alpha-N-acetylglucosaminidase n=1 Tax=Prevotella sp. 10(H) TaxID=1158294 RepID=UPI00068D7857|nr:alpha-N-acetylglucosaminidase [Prevotella sp. 10(H)]
MKNNILIILIFFSQLFFLSCDTGNKSTPAGDLAKRLLNERADNFIFETIESADGSDVFEIEAKGEKIVIGGNKELTKATGLNYYLENFCKCQVSLNYNQLNLPEKLPLPTEKIRIKTPFEYRYIFNYCTFGYTMPWWNFDCWEKMIDYMALKGINMPLAIIGQEAVWTEVYKELGVNREDLDSFFVGPAHLPWGWMGNIDGVAGPLPQSWIDKRILLQKQILERQRSLGMTPVLQAFTGHVPKELKQIYPDAKIMQIDSWAGIPGTYFLDPSDPLFTKIGSLFIKKQTELFGTDHLYDADCFIEVDPPSKDPEFLEKTSRAIYESMASVDKDAKWILQGWFFYFRQGFWQKEQGEAFFRGIPKDKAIVIDLYGEKNPTWDKTDSFYGQPWIWCVICNEDQKVNMSGHLHAMQEQFDRAWQSEKDNNLKGIGVIPEGIGYNPVVQDYIFSKAWKPESGDLNKWVEDYAARRYSTQNPQALKAWDHLLKSVYSRTRTMWSPFITTPQMVKFSGSKEDIRHNRVEFAITEEDPFAWDFNVYELAEAAKCLLDCADELKDVSTYRFDLTNVYRELLHALTHKYIHELSVAYDKKDLNSLQKAREQILKLIDDLDTVTGCDANFMLGKWLNEATGWGDTPDEKAYYNRNARTIITIWQPWEDGDLRDYAGRLWNGLLKDYYRPRWVLYMDMIEESIKANKPLDRKVFDKQVRKMDFQWTLDQKKYPDQPTGDIVKEANRIWKEYSSVYTKSK